MAQWVDFAELKHRVTMVDLLRHYGLLDGLKSQRGGEELVGLCPFHEERRGSFHVSTTKNGFNCFGCHRHGNILDLVAQKEDVTIRQAALLVAGWFNIEPDGRRRRPSGRHVVPLVAADITGNIEEGANAGTTDEDIVVANAPLTFELKGLDPAHPYLKERGLADEAIEHFGLGYCNRGLMRGRVVIPLHDEIGQLIGYAGRWPGEPPEGQERYKLPREFMKSAVVYNLHRVRQLAKVKGGLIVTEGFFTVFKLWQCGIENAAALMGSYLAEQQKTLLVETLGANGKVILLFDNDEAGTSGAAQCVQELVDQLYVKQVRLPEGVVQPEHLSDQELADLLRVNL